MTIFSIGGENKEPGSLCENWDPMFETKYSESRDMNTPLLRPTK
uniref:Uncharacterized protein n=1 Tax=viral metagenome TaxID=1070528 RepID=A0A6C0KZG5_9ZZZZ